MNRYKIVIEYFGTNFIGWQKQPSGISVQGVIEDAIFAFTKQKAIVYAAGRTDAGVHARGQVGHFDLDETIGNVRLMRALNHFIMPHKISIISCEKVTEDFHARFSAQRRHYEYIILNRSAYGAIDEFRVWHVHQNLDLNKMKKAAECLIGHHDFSSFRSKECQAHSPMKTLDQLDITRDGDYIKFNLSAKSFLHHMVRNIVGTLSMVGAGKFQPEDMQKILDAKDRAAAGVTASADGLYFMKVDY